MPLTIKERIYEDIRLYYYTELAPVPRQIAVEALLEAIEEYRNEGMREAFKEGYDLRAKEDGETQS